jgi:hypothetical protein
MPRPSLYGIRIGKLYKERDAARWRVRSGAFMNKWWVCCVVIGKGKDEGRRKRNGPAGNGQKSQGGSTAVFVTSAEQVGSDDMEESIKQETVGIFDCRG